MCTVFGIVKKGLAGVVGSATAILVGKANKGVGLVAGTAAFVGADIGLDYLESKLMLTKALRETEADANESKFEFFNDEFDDDYTNVAEETVTVESVTETMTSEETTIKTSKDDITNKTEETKKLSPLEEDKQRAKELDLKELDGEKEESPKGAPTNHRLNPTTRK